MIRAFAAWLGEFLAPYDPLLKLLSYVIGPSFAVIAFVWNRIDRRKLAAQAEELGERRSDVHRAHEQLQESRRSIADAQTELTRKGNEVEKLRSDLRGITQGAQELWKLRPPAAFAEYLSWLRNPAGAKLITFGNLKGGVGKTTLAANFAAYISHTRNKPVC